MQPEENTLPAAERVDKVDTQKQKLASLPLLFLNKGLRSRGAYPGCMAEQQTQGVCDQARQPLMRH